MTHRSRRWAIAVRLNPVGVLHAQGVMDLLLELNVRVDFVRHGDGSVTSLRYYLVINFDGPHGRIRFFKRNLREATIARALRCGEAATWWPC
jgi:hypothetical protein